MDELDLDGNAISPESVLTFTVEADDPRMTPTTVVQVRTSADGWSLASLEALTRQLQRDAEWWSGVQEDYHKAQGGIGAGGLEVLNVTLGVVGAVPAVGWLLQRLNRQVPPRPSHDSALDAAKWSIVSRYERVSRDDLTLTSETREVDHWAFTFVSGPNRDVFEVEVYGDSDSGGTTVTRLRWVNGDPWGPGPGPAVSEGGA